jgi:hypothetical protein
MSGLFGRFDFTKARVLFENASASYPFAKLLHDSLSLSDGQLVDSIDFCRSWNLFSILRCSFDDRLLLIRVLNAHLCDFAIGDRLCFAAWQETAGNSLLYLVDFSQTQSHVLRSLPSDLLCCESISEMIRLIFRLYTIESALYTNVNHFLHHFPISMVSKFLFELKGILNYIYLLQSSIEFVSHSEGFITDFVVYRGIKQASEAAPLYESMIGDVVVWRGFTSTSTNRDYVVHNFITDDECLLFEIVLHPGDVAVMIQEHSDYQSESEVLIGAGTGFEVVSVDYTTIDKPEVACDRSTFLRIPIVRLNYFLHWSDFDLDQLPTRVLI